MTDHITRLKEALEAYEFAPSVTSQMRLLSEFESTANPAAIRELLERLEQAEKDARRYRGLRAGAVMDYPSPEGASEKDAYLVVTGYGYQRANDLVDAAIDAAIAAQEGSAA